MMGGPPSHGSTTSPLSHLPGYTSTLFIGHPGRPWSCEWPPSCVEEASDGLPVTTGAESTPRPHHGEQLGRAAQQLGQRSRRKEKPGYMEL